MPTPAEEVGALSCFMEDLDRTQAPRLSENVPQTWDLRHHGRAGGAHLGCALRRAPDAIPVPMLKSLRSICLRRAPHAGRRAETPALPIGACGFLLTLPGSMAGSPTEKPRGTSTLVSRATSLAAITFKGVSHYAQRKLKPHQVHETTRSALVNPASPQACSHALQPTPVS